jgi:hypothetical protein
MSPKPPAASAVVSVDDEAVALEADEPLVLLVLVLSPRLHDATNKAAAQQSATTRIGFTGPPGVVCVAQR